MATRKVFSWLAVLVLLLSLAACAPNRPYRTRLPVEYLPGADTNRPSTLAPLGNPGNTTSLEVSTNGNGYKLGFVEFDDRGWFWSKDQWTALQKAIAEESANATNGVTVMVFVHGWKNNAASNSWNVVAFRHQLEDFSRSLGSRKLFAIYVGWRGLTLKNDYFPVPLGSEWTFWDRKDAAERIGDQGAATEMFRELQLLQQHFNDGLSTNDAQRRMELIIIGHSFGGQLVYSAVSQVLTERLTQAETTDATNAPQVIPSLGDQVILLNPAFEAALCDNLMNLAGATNINYATNQQPLLTIFTSRTDWATGLAFPAGRMPGALMDAIRPGKGTNEQWLFNVHKDNTRGQRTAIFETIGHDKDYLNFELVYTNYGNQNPLKKSDQETNSMQQVMKAVKHSKRPAPIYFPRIIYTTNLLGHVSQENYACILQAYNTNALGTPFFNVAVDKQIMNGHDDIDNPHLERFMLDYIEFTRTNYMRPKPGPQ